jgi:hypothetical protein
MHSAITRDDGSRHVHVRLEDAAAGHSHDLPLSVETFASRLGVSVHRAYRLLEAKAVPGAFKPYGRRRSHWFIPADAPRRFLERGEGGA